MEDVNVAIVFSGIAAGTNGGIESRVHADALCKIHWFQVYGVLFPSSEVAVL